MYYYEHVQNAIKKKSSKNFLNSVNRNTNHCINKSHGNSIENVDPSQITNQAKIELLKAHRQVKGAYGLSVKPP